jgi:toxin ParE1/3/4
MTHGYRLSPLAQHDIEDIAFYIALDNYGAAQRLVGRLFETFTLLADQPEIGRKRDDLGNVRSFVVKPYVVFYRHTEGGVEIVRILHGARDIISIFEDLETDTGAETHDN